MESTLLRSLKSSSSCSRIDGVIRARTISDRFSRLMKEKPRPYGNGAKPRLEGGGEAAWRRSSCGLFLWVEVGADIVPEDPWATVLISSRRLDGENAVGGDIPPFAPVSYDLRGNAYTLCKLCKAPGRLDRTFQNFHVPAFYTPC